MSSVEFKLSEEYPLEDNQHLRNILSSLVFTPCGRYGISSPKKYQLKEVRLCVTLPVIDFFERKVSYYRFKSHVHSQHDIIYCLNSTTLVSIFTRLGRFEQIVWNINHTEKTVNSVSERKYSHKVESWHMTIHKRCQKDLAVTYDEKIYNVWISAEPEMLGHHFVFLIPRNPNSQEHLKLFYVDLQTLPFSGHVIAEHYSLNQRGCAYIAPSVIENYLCFPACIDDKHIFNVVVTVKMDHLEDMIDAVYPDIEVLMALQGRAYETKILTSKNPGHNNIEEEYPALEMEYNTGRTHSVYWEKQTQNKLDNQRVMVVDLLTGTTYPSITAIVQAEDAFIVHPFGWLVQWTPLLATKRSKLNIIGGYLKEETVPSLFKLVQKKLIFHDFDIQSISEYSKILFN